jgi:hypothetical protein
MLVTVRPQRGETSAAAAKAKMHPAASEHNVIVTGLGIRRLHLTRSELRLPATPACRKRPRARRERRGRSRDPLHTQTNSLDLRLFLAEIVSVMLDLNIRIRDFTQCKPPTLSFVSFGTAASCLLNVNRRRRLRFARKVAGPSLPSAKSVCHAVEHMMGPVFTLIQYGDLPPR